jgi:hypothetical protein
VWHFIILVLKLHAKFQKNPSWKVSEKSLEPFPRKKRDAWRDARMDGEADSLGPLGLRPGTNKSYASLPECYPCFLNSTSVCQNLTVYQNATLF